MTCERIYRGDQPVGFMCSSEEPEPPKPCPWFSCEREATKACDGVAPRRKSGSCDKLMCDAHAHPLGEDRDLCPACMKRGAPIAPTVPPTRADLELVPPPMFNKPANLTKRFWRPR